MDSEPAVRRLRSTDAAAGAQLLTDLDDRGRQVRFLIHDRHRKLPPAFDAIFAGVDAKIIRTPVQGPNAKANVERWIGSVRRECLDRLPIVGRRPLEHVLRVPGRHARLQRRDLEANV
jgi:putative transposase